MLVSMLNIICMLILVLFRLIEGLQICAAFLSNQDGNVTLQIQEIIVQMNVIFHEYYGSFYLKTFLSCITKSKESFFLDSYVKSYEAIYH